MSPVAAGSSVLLSVALLGIDRRTERGGWPAQYLCFGALMGAAFGLLGVILGPSVSPATLSLPGAVSYFALASGLLCSRADWAMGGLLATRSQGAKLLRRAFPAALLVLGAIGFSISKPLLAENHFTWVQVSVLAVFSSALLAAFIGWMAFIVERSEAERRKVEAALDVTPEQLGRRLDRIQEPQSEPKLRRRARWAFIMAIFLTGLLGFFSWQAAQKAAEDADWVAHTREILTTLEAMLRHSVDVETGGRGFAETGSRVFLEPFESGRQAVGHDLRTLGLLLADNPEQAQRLSVLGGQSNAQVEDAGMIVAARQNAGTVPSVAQFERGKLSMDMLRGTVERMEAEERRLLEQRIQRFRVVRHLSASIIACGSFLGVVFLSIAGITVSREIGAGARARAQINSLNTNLERRVLERTAALEAEVAERAKTEAKLRASEEMLRLLFDGIKDYAVYMLDPYGCVASWNAGAALMKGYQAEEIVGRHYSCLFTPELIAEGKPAQELEQALAEGTVNVEGWRVRKDGARFWVNGTLTVLYDENRQVRGFAKITRDMTAKRRNDELLGSVLNHTLDGIIGIDARGTVSMINRAGEEIFGRPGSEVIGQNIKMLMPAPYHAEHDGYLKNYIRTGDAKIIGIGREVRGLRKDGSTFPLDLAVTEFQLDNERYFVGIVRDISEKKKLEAQLHQSQKMDAFGQLAGGVAHDFNNLLTVISGYSDLLLTKLPPGDPRAKMVDQVRRAAERAASLTRQLLAFSRQQVLEPKILDINIIVSDLDKMLHRLIGEDVQVTTLLGAALSPVKVDAGQIEQVIVNLAVNARDAMPQGGKLTIETRNCELDESCAHAHPEAKTGGYVMVAISDTGCGMTAEVRARIFEPFFTTKGVGKGTGLGLAVVHGIVKQSGGILDVYSEAGIGTVFRIYLPAVERQANVSQATGPESPPRGHETILLVEDENSVRELATLVLEECGYTVMTAPEGLAALSLMAACREKVDLLLTDVVMPQMGGRKLAETLLAQHPELRVLFMSGYTDDAVVRHGVLQANTNFLQKPFTPNSLAKRVREVLDHS
jgi:PAS domain S-box-containing protein